MRTFVPFDLERRDLLGSAHMVRHDGDGVVEPDDLAYTLHSLRCRIIYASYAPTEHGRLRQGCDFDAGRRASMP